MGGKKKDLQVEIQSDAPTVEVPVVAVETKSVIKSWTVWFNVCTLTLLVLLPFINDLTKVWINNPIVLDKIQQTVTLLIGLLNGLVNLYLRIFKTDQPLSFKGNS